MGLFSFRTEKKYYISPDEEKLNYIIKTLNKMGKNIDEIKQGLADATAKVEKVAADVQRLHDTIANADVPTQAEWDEIKASVATLNSSLQTVDDTTPE